MVQELSATPTEVEETTAPAPVETADAPTLPDEAAPATPEEAPEEDPDAALTALIDAEDFPHREALTRKLDATREEGWKAAEEYLAPQIQQIQQTEKQRAEMYGEANSQLGTLNGRLAKLINEGMVSEEGLTNILQSNPKAWSALQAIGEDAQGTARNEGYTQGRFYEARAAGMALYGDLFKAAGKPSAMAKFTPMFTNAQTPEQLKSAHSAAQEALKAAFASQLIPLGRKGGAEEEKVKQRANQKVTQGGGTPSGKSVSSMSDADARYILPDNHPDKISDADYKAARERYGIK